MLAHLLHPLAPLVALSALTTLVLYAHAEARVGPSPAVEALLQAAPALLVPMWIDADARRAGRQPCFDFGLFVLFTYPASLVWYCFWSRGWAGLPLLLLLAGLLLGPYAVVALLC